MNKFNTPILFLIFNRPDTTFKVFKEIKKIKPSKLYIAADGVRQNKPDEKEKCEKTRQVIKEIDWGCDVKTLFRDKNLGCKIAVSSAITWFFENEEEGIILEDDCLPNQSFFQFCSEMLNYYRTNHEVMHIGGSNFIHNKFPVDKSYYFSRHNHIWGWATWKRAWTKYDVFIKDLPNFYEQRTINTVFNKNSAKYYWLYKFIKVYLKKIDTWDYQWSFAIWQNNGKSIIPSVNLIANIGFEEQATHSLKNIKNLANLVQYDITKISHPINTQTNEKLDYISDKEVFKLSYFKNIIFFFLVKWLYQFKIRFS